MKYQLVVECLALCLALFGIARLAATNSMAGWLKPLPLLASIAAGLLAGPALLLLMGFVAYLVVHPDSYRFMPSLLQMVLSSVSTLVWAMTYRHYRFKSDFDMSFRLRRSRRRIWAP